MLFSHPLMILIFFVFLTDFHHRIIISENCQVIRYTFLGKAAKFGHRAFFAVVVIASHAVVQVMQQVVG